VIASDNALVAAWRETLARRADQPAIFASDGAVLRRFQEIEDEALTLATRVREFSPGSVIALQIGNSPSWPALLLALFRAALVPLPLGRHMADAELGAALEAAGALALVRIGDNDVAFTRRVPVAREVSADFLKLTSGTTAAPRAIRFRAEQLVADCTNICETMGITESDVNYGVIPMSHSYGFSNLLTPLLCRGVPLVATEERLPRAILEGLARTGATVFPGMPLFFQHLGESGTVPELRQLRLCISAGAPLTRDVAERFAQKFGRRIHAFYGSSECGGITYDTAAEADAEEGFVGNSMHGVTITHRGDGESIEVRSAAVGDGYFPNDEPATLGGGRFVPGDLVRCTERGFVLAGRASDVINIAGRKLNPLEVEQRLLTCPGVRQAFVFGIPSRIRGEEPVACIAGEGIEREAVSRFCQGTLSPWQMPRDFWIVPGIPANERGKVNRRALAEAYLKSIAP